MEQAEEKREQDLRAALASDPATYRINWLVEAGAGAGKTYLIVERMVNQLASGFCSPEQLVAITFTNKATNQLRERLTTALLARRDNAAGEERQRLDEVLRRMDAIQISTIHSFCQRLLREMPLEAGLPVSFALQDQEETLRYRTRFFHACCRDHADWFAPAQAWGIQPASLREGFLALMDCGDEEIVCLDDASRQTLEAQAVCQAEKMRQDWTGGFPAEGASDWQTPLLKQILSYPQITTCQQALGWVLLAQRFAGMRAPRDTGYKLPIIKADKKKGSFDIQLLLAPQARAQVAALWQPYYDACERWVKAEQKLQKARDAKSPKPNTIDKAMAAYRETLPGVKRYSAMPECRFAAACYGLLKKRKDPFGALEQNLSQLLHAVATRTLLRCRQALQEEMTARGLVSYDDLLRRTRTMLKNSPAARAHFAAQRFVVYVDEFQDTDPVQAQMLFYLTAAAEGFRQDWTCCVPRPGSLFLVGDPKQSIYRFRRADIGVYNQVRERFDRPDSGCRVAELRFNFRSTPALCQYATDIFAPKMQGGPGQADFLEMRSRRRDVAGRPVCQIGDADPAAAPDGIAAWIAAAVAGGQARCRDFLILCYTKKQVEGCRLALRRRGLPVNAAGQHTLSDTAPIARCAYWCDFLLHPRSLPAAVQLLVRAGFTPPALYALQQATGQPLDELLKTRADSLQALLPELPEALRPLLRMVLRMQVMRSLARTLPPMALLEELFRGEYGLWDGAPDPEDFGWVCEYLARLRQWQDQGLEGLLNKAIRLAGAEVEYPLAYESNADEIQLMNLHKAKGLEGRIVILAPGGRTNRAANRHLQGGKAWLCQKFRLDLPDAGGSFTACPPDWAQRCAEEETAAEAERLRLLYVAATRAGEHLIVWHKPEDKRFPDAWAELEGGTCLNGQTPDVLPGLSDAALFAPETVTVNRPAASLVLPGPAEDAALKQALHRLPAAARLAITPSRLDHPAPPARTLQEGDALPVPPAAEQAAAPEEEPTPVPHGSEWGTIVHRTLELAVNAAAWGGPALYRLARQAVGETLPEGTLTPRQYRQLTGTETPVAYPELSARLAQLAGQACAPLLAEDAALRGLLAQGAAMTEYPFYLSLTDPADPLYRHISDNLAKDVPAGRAIDLNGVLDLVIRTAQGWTVVDYKTDRLFSGETGEQYARRLRCHYLPQIRTYAGVLRRLADLPVRSYLCAVPLGGALIDLDAPEQT